MDFIVFFSLVGSYMLSLFFSYDIVCQWFHNSNQMDDTVPIYMQIAVDRIHKAKFVLPKFHIYNHGFHANCYSLSIIFITQHRWTAKIQNAGRLIINPVSMSTWEMGPGSRMDTINDHALAWTGRRLWISVSLILILFKLCPDCSYRK